jgi:hypothetical protein
MTVDRTYIVDVFEDIISNIRLIYDPIVTGTPTTGGVKPYSYYGHMEDVIKDLIEKDNNKLIKYPLIVLIQDIKEKKGGDMALESKTSPRIWILEESKKDFDPADRYTNSFKTVLYPLYKLLIDEIEDNPAIINYTIENEKTDRLYWGTEKAGGAAGLPLNDYLDGIDIVLKDLGIFKQFDYEGVLSSHV